MPSAVKHPRHYTSHPSGVECIAVAQHMPFNIGNALKYLWRAGLKTKDPIQDLEKAKQYLDFEIERIRSERAKAAKKSRRPARRVKR